MKFKAKSLSNHRNEKLEKKRRLIEFCIQILFSAMHIVHEHTTMANRNTC